MTTPDYRMAFGSAELLQKHPPVLRHAHKQALFEVAYPTGTEPAGSIEVTRWRPASDERLHLPEAVACEFRPDFYDYTPVIGDGAGLDWHVNFADPRLFVAYGSGLLAQDEMQVVEHPLLGCVREALESSGVSTLTEEGDEGTPILVRGVERRLRIDTAPDAAAGRPQGLYGNRFARTPVDVVRKAVTVVDPPTWTNLVAIAAPVGSGEYTAEQIGGILRTAVTGFAAARSETVRACGPESETAVHSGFWGCGAFGGNRRLMIALQLLAVRACGIGHMVLHCGDRDGVREAERGAEVAETLAIRCGPDAKFDSLIDKCAEFGFRWGVSDGN